VRLTVGDQSASMLLEAGAELTREATSDIVLRVGDAGALVVIVNDKAMPPLGREGEVVTRRITRPVLLPAS
jgi:hypothetical protein